MITVKILIWVTVIMAFVLYDYATIRHGERPFYLLNWIFRGMAFIIYGAWIWDTQADIRTVNLLLFCVTSFWLIFDAVLGFLLHRNPLYIGPTSGWIDRLAVSNTAAKVGYWILKAMALYVCVRTVYNIYVWN